MKDRVKKTGTKKTANTLLLNGRRAALIVAGLILGFGLAMPQTSLAANKHRHEVKKVQVRHGHQVRRTVVTPLYRMPRGIRVRGGGFAVPHRIAARVEVNRFRPFFRGRIYDASHRHYHDVYDFPVDFRDPRVTRPYVYCNGQLHGGLSLSFNRPGFSVAVGW